MSCTAIWQARPGLTLEEGPGTTFAYIGFNLDDPVLSSRDVRAAIAHAIDRDAIIRYLFGGRAQGRVGAASAALAGVSDLPHTATTHSARATTCGVRATMNSIRP